MSVTTGPQVNPGGPPVTLPAAGPSASPAAAPSRTASALAGHPWIALGVAYVVLLALAETEAAPVAVALSWALVLEELLARTKAHASIVDQLGGIL